MLTNLWDNGDCQFCFSVLSVVWFERLRKRVCGQCGRDLKGQLIQNGASPKTLKAYLRPSAANDLKVLKAQRES